MTEAEEKIINATVECIEKYGMSNTTIRKIGEIAGMNSASINYYFRSKEALMEKVLSITLSNAFRWEDFAYTESMTFEEQLAEVFIFLVNGALKYPKITQAHFYEMIQNNDFDIPARDSLNTFLEKLIQEGFRRHPLVHPQKLRIAVMGINTATMMYFAYFSRLMDLVSPFDLSIEIERNKYIKSIIHTFLKELSIVDRT
ncbi:MAG: TetR/AcrR family transcriptional regulator [Firmicutes bacterium]|nr:TetR/AcrR family transcriptional regulator [Bacillota bacterium]